MSKKDDDGDEMGMTECPKCGEMFEPKDDKGKKHVADLRERAASADLRASTEESNRKAAEADRDLRVKQANDAHDLTKTELEKTKALLHEASTKALALEVDAELAPLVGVKLAPAEKDGHVEIGKMFLGQGDAGKAKWAKHIEGIKTRPDMSMRAGGSVLGAESAEDRANRGAGTSDDDGAAAVALLNG